MNLPSARPRLERKAFAALALFLIAACAAPGREPIAPRPDKAPAFLVATLNACRAVAQGEGLKASAERLGYKPSGRQDWWEASVAGARFGVVGVTDEKMGAGCLIDIEGKAGTFEDLRDALAAAAKTWRPPLPLRLDTTGLTTDGQPTRTALFGGVQTPSDAEPAVILTEYLNQQEARFIVVYTQTTNTQY